MPHTRRNPAVPRLGRMLLVDDEPQLRFLLMSLFAHAGYDVVGADTAAHALALLDAAPFDAVLLDLMLPDGSGEAVLRAIRARPAPGRCRVVVLTACDAPGRLDPLRPLADAVLVKPVTLTELVAAMRPEVG